MFTRFNIITPGPALYDAWYNGTGNNKSIKSLDNLFRGTSGKFCIEKRPAKKTISTNNFFEVAVNTKTNVITRSDYKFEQNILDPLLNESTEKRNLLTS